MPAKNGDNREGGVPARVSCTATRAGGQAVPRPGHCNGLSREAVPTTHRQWWREWGWRRERDIDEQEVKHG